MKQTKGEAPVFKSLEIFQLASNMARHAGARQAIVSQNVAHANTPGYEARDIGSFADSLETNRSSSLKTTNPRHMTGSNIPGLAAKEFLAEGPAAPNGNTVSIETEILRSIEAEREQSRALAIYQSASNILKTTIGRGR